MCVCEDWIPVLHNRCMTTMTTTMLWTNAVHTPHSHTQAAVVHDQLNALAYLMEDLSPQLDLPRLLLLAQRSGAHHVASYLQQRVQSMLLSASTMLHNTAHAAPCSSSAADAAISDSAEPPSATPSSAARQPSMATTCCSSSPCPDDFVIDHQVCGCKHLEAMGGCA